MLEKGKRRKIIKEVDRNLFSAFIFHPISYLADPRLCHGVKMEKADLETSKPTAEKLKGLGLDV